MFNFEQLSGSTLRFGLNRI